MGKTFPTVIGPFKFDHFSIDLQTNTAARNGSIIRLSPMQAEILYILVARAPGEASHFDMEFGLYGCVGGPDNYLATLATLISRMRNQLAAIGVFIEPADEFGYKLVLRTATEPHSAAQLAA